MKMHTLKKLGLLTAAVTLVSSFTVTAEEETAELPYMEADQVYDIDLDQDGSIDEVSYETYTEETDGFSRAVLKIQMNGTTVFDITAEDWSYFWTVDSFTLGDNNTYLLASCISDNDWNSQSLVLSFSSEEHVLQVISDLVPVSRESEEVTDSVISSWGRSSYVSEAENNTFTVPWADTLMSTGIVSLPVVYELADDGVTVSDQPILLDPELIWTVWHEFDTFTEPGGTEPAFHVGTDEIVSLPEVTVIDGISYVKCVNKDGLEGWYQDPESYVSGGEDADGNYLAGYFKEAFFAG